MSQLLTIRLCGALDSKDGDYEFDVDVPEARAMQRILLVRDAAENYVLSGGDWPNLESMAL